MFLTHQYARNCPLNHLRTLMVQGNVRIREELIDTIPMSIKLNFLSHVKFECDRAIMLYTISDTQDLMIMKVD